MTAQILDLQTVVADYLTRNSEPAPDVTGGEWVSVSLASLPFLVAFDRVPWDGETLALLGYEGRWKPVALTKGRHVVCRRP
jgi:hypothetical protein